MPETQTTTNRLATVRQAAEFLTVSRGTILNMIRDGSLRSIRVRRSLRLDWSEIERVARFGTGDEGDEHA